VVTGSAAALGPGALVADGLFTAKAFCRLSIIPSRVAISMGVSAVPSHAERLDVMVMAWASEQAGPLR
jgi:hypothetical protein